MVARFFSPGADDTVSFAALQGADTTVVVSGEQDGQEVTALAVAPAGDELLVGLADGSVNAHALPSGNTQPTLSSCPSQYGQLP